MVDKYNLDEGYDNNFFDYNNIEQHTLGNFLIPKLIDLFNPTSVLDVGCAAGGQIEIWRNHNIKAFGVEGSRNAWNIASSFARQYMRLLDLRDAVENKMFEDIDLVQSYEVAEHVEEHYADNYVNVICIHEPKNIIMTAAAPGQSGTYHVNCQPKQYWIEKISSKGYTFNQDKVNQVVSWGIGEERPFPDWWPKNVMVFEKIIK